MKIRLCCILFLITQLISSPIADSWAAPSEPLVHCLASNFEEPLSGISLRDPNQQMLGSPKMSTYEFHVDNNQYLVEPVLNYGNNREEGKWSLFYYKVSGSTSQRFIQIFNQLSLQSDEIILHQVQKESSPGWSLRVLPTFYPTKYTLAQVSIGGNVVKGSAHPSTYVHSFITDNCTGQEIDYKQLFTDTQQVLNIISNKSVRILNDKYHVNSFQSEDTRLSPNVSNYPVIIPDFNGLEVYLPPDQFGIGVLNFEIPCTTIKPLLAIKYKNICI